jgi:hypothetical protein
MDWMKVTLANAEAHDQGKWRQLQDSFEATFLAERGPADAAMFHGNDHERSWFYFSPGAVHIFAAVLTLFKAEYCNKPPRPELGLLVGHQDAWRLVEAQSGI